MFWREKPLLRALRPHLTAAQSIADVGAGSCKLARLLVNRLGTQVTPIDVVDHNVTDLPLQVYDGKRIPFPDRTFDISIVVFALHHAADPGLLLSESARISRGLTLVVEDTPRNSFERRAWRLFDDAMNHHTHDDIRLAEQARNAAQWEGFFRDEGFAIGSTRPFRTVAPVLCSFQHTLYVLRNDR